MQMII
ncbi:hypothetical protein Patl1_05446 [Pistacia atlantica]